jgi:FSR family fosmidomycin resistance protein-like MFS transporter
MTEPGKKTGFLLAAAWRGLALLSSVILLIEFMDEFNYGVQGSALPAQRLDLTLNYAQVGMLLGLPHLVNIFIEPFLMLLGDTRWRKGLIVGGGLAVSLGLGLTAAAPSFFWLLLAALVLYPASGAFVTLAQATLMDLHPGRESQMMARWVFSGSLANLAGPLFLGGLFALALGWRTAFILLASLALGLTLWIARFPFPKQVQEPGSQTRFSPAPFWSIARHEAIALVSGLRAAISNTRLLRWLFLLELADLMMDVLTLYMALYFNDVVHISEKQIPFLMALLTTAGLISDLVMIYLLERYPGRGIVRISAAVILVLYPTWLLVPLEGPLSVGMKIALAVAIKLLVLGWYTVLQGEAYAAMPERKGTMLALAAIAGFLGGLFPWLIGGLAARFGLQAAMWILLLGPVSLVLFVPKPHRR